MKNRRRTTSERQPSLTYGPLHYRRHGILQTGDGNDASATMGSKKRLYRVVFVNQGKVYEIYARRVNQGDMYGFVEVEDILFGEKSAVVIDPSEERLKAEFEGVSRTHLPLHAIVRIDEVERQGAAKILPLGKAEEVIPFPGPLGPMGKKSGKD